MFTPENKKALQVLSCKAFVVILVIPLGLEPRTHTLKVYCSTN
jgi:hypothetical protein